MKKIENPAMKSFLVEYVRNTFSNNELFVDVFGKNFAKKRLKANLNKVYTTDEESKKHSGYYCCSTKEITLCRLNKDGKMLSPNDITQDINSEFSQEILQLVLHESVHAIFARDERETGINFSEEIDFPEYGRALNEGLTEWVTVKAGFDERRIGGYRLFYNFVKELELALGPEAVMKLGGAKDIKDVSKILGFEKDFSTIFSLNIADEIYKSNDLERNARIVRQAISDHKPRENFSEEEENEYRNFFESNDEGYAIYLDASGLEDSEESKIGYMDKIQKDAKEDRLKNKMYFESIVFDKYFRKEFEEFSQMENIPEEEFQRFNELRKYMGHISDKDLIFDNKKNVLLNFSNKFQEIQKKYAGILWDKLSKDFDSKRITPELLENYEERFKNISLLDENIGLEIFDSVVSEKISGKMQDEPETASVKWLLKELGRKEEIKDFSKYSISIRDTDDGGLSYIYLKDGKPVFSQKGIIGKSFSVKDEIPMSAIDFTEELGEDVQKRVNNFLDFKSQILRLNPDAQIVILDREIAVCSNGTYTYFKFVGDKLESLVELGDIELNKFFKESEKTINEENSNITGLPEKVKKESLFRRFLNKISNIRSSKKRENFDEISQAAATAKTREIADDKNKFEERIRVDELKQSANYKTNEVLADRDSKQNDGR